MDFRMGKVTAYHTPFKCIGPILTTFFCFSLFKIPSLRPRVMPTTLSNLVPFIMWLSVSLVLASLGEYILVGQHMDLPSRLATQVPFTST